MLLALRQVHGFFQSEFSKECDLVLLLSISNFPPISLRLSSSCSRLLPPFPVTYILILSFLQYRTLEGNS
jgi:hypothetical protein